VTAEFIVNNKIHSATKVSPFMANYRRELRMGADIRKKRKIKKTTEFTEKMKKVQEEAGMVLRKAQEKMKWEADRGRKRTEEWRKDDKVMLSIKNLVFKERLVKKLVDQYVDLYFINKVVSTNTVILQLPMVMRIYPVC